MKRFSTLLAGLLLVGAVASAADYAVLSEVTLNNGPDGDDHLIEYQVAAGYMALSENLTFTFDIDKEAYETDDAETLTDEFGLTYKLPATEMAGKTFSNEVSLGYVVDDSNSDTKKVTYVTGTDMMGMSTDLELIASLDEEDRDAYEANLYLGDSYGENWNLSVELYNAYAHDGEHSFSYETYLNYDLPLGGGFAFNTEFSLNGDEYKYAEFYAAPQIKYSYSVNEETSVYAKAVYEAFKATSDDMFDDDFEQVDGNAAFTIGVSYSK